ncbi:MAG: serine/threonine-protein kinase, partial [Planctomycetota bacterium]
MSNIADEYEQWFRNGNRAIEEFIGARALSADDLHACVFADQFLRNEAGLELDTGRYARLLPAIAREPDLQAELWIEAYGYAEETTAWSDANREQFLREVPQQLRASVEAAICSGDEVTSAAPPDLSTHSTRLPEIPRYRIERELGRGSFGVVYRAWDLQLERSVALKVLQHPLSTEDLFAEARVVAKLETPGIISVYDCGIEAGGQSFFVTPLLQGSDLRTWADSIHRSDWPRICTLFVRLCQALGVAHQAGIVHRDIKPTNIIVRDDDQPCLLDFGLALSRSGNQAHMGASHPGELVGT